MNKSNKSPISISLIVVLSFLTVATRSIIEIFYPFREAIVSLDANVWIVILIDFAYYFLIFVSWWFLVIIFKKVKKREC